MIYVEITQQIQIFITRMGLTSEAIIETINDRHKGFLAPGFGRLLATHWFSDEGCVFVDAKVTRKTVDEAKGRVQIHEVRPMLALKLKSELPVGRIDREMEIKDLMENVARSFGHPVSCHTSTDPVHLYSGPWDGSSPRIVGGQPGPALVLGTFSRETQSVFALWAVDIEKYFDWLEGDMSTGDVPKTRSVAAQAIDGGPSDRQDVFQKDSISNPSKDSGPKMTELFRNECSKKFGVRPRHALEAANRPDQTAVLEHGKAIIRIHSKLIGQAASPFHLIIVEQVNGDDTAIIYALKAYSDLCDGFDKLAPNDMLEALADRFGIPIRIGATIGKFIWAAKVEIQSQNDISVVASHAPPGGSFSQQMLLTIQQGPPMVADVAMAYCLNTKEYVAWLHQHKR